MREQALYQSAVLLTALGTEAAARVLSCLPEPDMEALIGRMAMLGHVSGVERDRILANAEADLPQYAGGVSAGPEYSRQVLEQAIGPERAAKMLAPEQIAQEPTLEDLLKTTPPETLAAMVADEHPQIIAVLVKQLTAERAAKCLAALEPSIRVSVAERLVQLEEPSPRALELLETTMLERFGMGLGNNRDESAGARSMADILSHLRRSMESQLITSLEERSPEIVRQINRFRFTFENLLEQDGRTLQRVLRDVDAALLPLVVKGLSEEQQMLVFANMSERAAERVQEEVMNLGPVRLRDIEAAQQELVNMARVLADRGEVNLVMAASSESDEEEALV